MRIGDWSSDVCSSDLCHPHAPSGATRIELFRPLKLIQYRPRTGIRAIERKLGLHPPDIPRLGRRPASAARRQLLIRHIQLQQMPMRIDSNRIAFAHQRNTATHRRLRRNMRSEEHTSELQSLMRISYAVFCLKKKKNKKNNTKLT